MVVKKKKISAKKPVKKTAKKVIKPKKTAKKVAKKTAKKAVKKAAKKIVKKATKKIVKKAVSKSQKSKTSKVKKTIQKSAPKKPTKKVAKPAVKKSAPVKAAPKTVVLSVVKKSIVQQPVVLKPKMVQPDLKVKKQVMRESANNKMNENRNDDMTAVHEPVARPASKKATTLLGALEFMPYEPKAGEAYMSDLQRDHFRKILDAWKHQLMQDVDLTVGHLKEDAVFYADPVDRASQEEGFNLELRTRDRERKLIKKIEQSLDLINTGEYGFCEDCGAEIGIRRLEARPTAVKCIDCKTFQEIREKQLGG